MGKFENNIIKTLDEMLNLPLNNSRQMTESIKITRVPGGWIYTIKESGLSLSSTFVPEPKTENTVEPITQKTQDVPNPDNLIYYIIHWQDKNNNEKSKMYHFNDENHFQNWWNVWERNGNKIVGVHPCNKLGEITDDKNKVVEKPDSDY